MGSTTRRNRGAAVLHVGDLVRIQAHDSRQHFGKGVVVEVRRHYALVKPFPRHGHNERLPLTDLQLWKSANEQAKVVATGRKRA